MKLDEYQRLPIRSVKVARANKLTNTYKMIGFSTYASGLGLICMTQ